MRYVLLDRVTELGPGLARGLKCVSASEDVFADHFVGAPLYPGALLIETLAQLGGLLAEEDAVLAGGERVALAVLVGVDAARFSAPVRPGDRLVLEAVGKGNAERCRVVCRGQVDGVEVVCATLTFVFETGHADALLEAHRRRREVWLHGLERAGR